MADRAYPGQRRVTLDELRRYAVSRSLFVPTTLGRAVQKLGFVQADPIRAPARAQDLTLRHRVAAYRNGDLERRYPTLPVEEDFFVNYGFLPRPYQQLMHPRIARDGWTALRARRAAALLDFVRERGAVHPRTVAAHFLHGKITNWFGGSSNATTHLLDEMHFRGMLRIAGRENGTRLYAAAAQRGMTGSDGLPAERFDALIDVIMNKYAPLPAASLGQLLSLLCIGIPQWRRDRGEALARARLRFPHARVDGVDWYWVPGESPAAARWRTDDDVRLLTPFDPIVWDRRRFALLWGWRYRFEAYTPAPRRTLGYYALPLLWRGHVIGWANLRSTGLPDAMLQADFGYVEGASPAGIVFRDGLEAELERMRVFLAPQPRQVRNAPVSR